MSYGIEHIPLMARVQPNRRNPSKVVAFIGHNICFFEQDSYVPTAGQDVEVMITRVLYGTYPEGHKYHGYFNRGFIKALMVEVVDVDKHMLIAIDGFECSGTMCRTTAHGRETDGQRALTSDEFHRPKQKDESRDAWLNRSKGGMWLTPGRTDIYVAGNINVKHGDTPTPRRTTNIWVERKMVEQTSGCGVRAHGLTRLEDGIWYIPKPIAPTPKSESISAFSQEIEEVYEEPVVIQAPVKTLSRIGMFGDLLTQAMKKNK